MLNKLLIKLHGFILFLEIDHRIGDLILLEDSIQNEIAALRLADKLFCSEEILLILIDLDCEVLDLLLDKI